MTRRLFLGTLGAGLLARPRTASGQPAGRVGRLGILLYGSAASDPQIKAFLDALRELGWVEGRSLIVEVRGADGRPERLPELAAELARLKPDALFALGGDVAPHARRATDTVPVVVYVSVDPVASGLVSSLSRPGANITGVTLVSNDLAGKRLQFLKEAAPRLARVAVLWNPEHPDPEYHATVTAGRALGIQVQSLEVTRAEELDGALQAAVKERAEALVVVSSRLTSLNRARILELAARGRLPVAAGWGPWAAGGALLSYGPDLDEAARQAAGLVDRVLKGAKPADLPVQQPVKFELVVNLVTARTLGLQLPQTLLNRADLVISQ